MDLCYLQAKCTEVPVVGPEDLGFVAMRNITSFPAVKRSVSLILIIVKGKEETCGWTSCLKLLSLIELTLYP